MPSFHSTDIVYITDDPTGDNQAFNRGYFISQGRSLLGIDTGDSVTFGGLTIGAYTFPVVDGSNGQCLKTNGLGVLTWEAVGVATHGSDHVNGTDDVPIVTASVKGLMPPNDQATELATTGDPAFASVSGSVGNPLKLQSNSVENIEMFSETVVGDTSAGGLFRLHRKANEGNAYIDFQISSFNSFLLNYTFGSFGIQSGASALRLQYAAASDLIIFGNAVSGQSKKLSVYGYRAGDQLRSISLSVGLDKADSASIAGVGEYIFDGRLTAKSGTSDDSSYGLDIKNSSGANIINGKGDGTVNIQKLHTSSKRVKSYLIKTESYTIADSDPEIIYYDTDAVALTSTLPASPTDGSIRFVKNTGSSSNNLTVARNGNLIDGAASDVTLPDGIGKYFQYTTAGWQMI